MSRRLPRGNGARFEFAEDEGDDGAGEDAAAKADAVFGLETGVNFWGCNGLRVPDGALLADDFAGRNAVKPCPEDGCAAASAALDARASFEDTRAGSFPAPERAGLAALRIVLVMGSAIARIPLRGLECDG